MAHHNELSAIFVTGGRVWTEMRRQDPEDWPDKRSVDNTLSRDLECVKRAQLEFINNSVA